MSDQQPPRRRFHVLFDAHADTLEDLERAVEEMSHELDVLDRAEDTLPTVERTVGGVTSGWHLAVREDPTMTPERYQADLSAWLAQKRGGDALLAETPPNEPST